VTIAPQARAQLERHLAELERDTQLKLSALRAELERSRERVHRDAERLREQALAAAERAREQAHAQAERSRDRARVEAERAKQLAEREAKRAHEQARRSVGGHHAQAAQPSSGSARERELEKRVAELEARLADMEKARGAHAGPGSTTPSGPQSFPGQIRFRARAASPDAHGGGFFHVTPQADDPECNPSRVRVFRLGTGQHEVVVPDGAGAVVELDGNVYHLPDFQAQALAWGKDVARWAEQFGREFSDEHCERWAEAAEEAAEAFREAWDDQLEQLEELEDQDEDDAEELEELELEEHEDADDAEREERGLPTLNSLFTPGQDVVSAPPVLSNLALLGSLLSGQASAVRAPLAARTLLNSQAPLGGLDLASQTTPIASEQLRSAVSQMQAEVDGLREALRELREQLERRRADGAR